ncbi:MAG: helix-turn-helix domain-containing protein [Prevotellaceae bacterium]|jgi:AraC-like DNA-binding protein|nr:helix-turn-helix domain-containing protein [Prevotellaceae bacterium]
METVESAGSRLFGGAASDKLFYGFSINSSSGRMFGERDVSRRLSDGGIFICLRGESEFFLDLKNYRLKAGDMCVTFPFSILQTVSTSNDFEGFGMGVSVELFHDIQIPSLTDYYLHIKNNPCISLSSAEQEMLTELCRQMVKKYERVDHPFRMEIVNSLFKTLYYEIAAIYKRGKPVIQGAVLRKEMLFRKFLFLAAQSYRQHREVDYYARELCVTARYLSSVVKEKSGMSATKWISGMVIRQAKILLKDSHLSVQQVADALNFANPSFFGQYFKKYTGITPKKFRDGKV